MKPQKPLVACGHCVMNTLTDHAQDIPEMALLLMSIRGMKIAQWCTDIACITQWKHPSMLHTGPIKLVPTYKCPRNAHLYKTRGFDARHWGTLMERCPYTWISRRKVPALEYPDKRCPIVPNWNFPFCPTLTHTAHTGFPEHATTLEQSWLCIFTEIKVDVQPPPNHQLIMLLWDEMKTCLHYQDTVAVGKITWPNGVNGPPISTGSKKIYEFESCSLVERKISISYENNVKCTRVESHL